MKTAWDNLEQNIEDIKKNVMVKFNQTHNFALKHFLFGGGMTLLTIASLVEFKRVGFVIFLPLFAALYLAGRVYIEITKKEALNQDIPAPVLNSIINNMSGEQKFTLNWLSIKQWTWKQFLSLNKNDWSQVESYQNYLKNFSPFSQSETHQNKADEMISKIDFKTCQKMDAVLNNIVEKINIINKDAQTSQQFEFEKIISNLGDSINYYIAIPENVRTSNEGIQNTFIKQVQMISDSLDELATKAVGELSKNLQIQEKYLEADKEEKNNTLLS